MYRTGHCSARGRASDYMHDRYVWCPVDPPCFLARPGRAAVAPRAPVPTALLPFALAAGREVGAQFLESIQP